MKQKVLMLLTLTCFLIFSQTTIAGNGNHNKKSPETIVTDNVNLSLADALRSSIFKDLSILGSKQCFTVFFTPDLIEVGFVTTDPVSCDTEITTATWLSFEGAGIDVQYLQDPESGQCAREITTVNGIKPYLDYVDCSTVDQASLVPQTVFITPITVGGTEEFTDLNIKEPNNSFIANLSSDLVTVVGVTNIGTSANTDVSPTLTLTHAKDGRVIGANHCYREVDTANGLPFVQKIDCSIVADFGNNIIQRDWSRVF